MTPSLLALALSLADPNGFPPPAEPRPAAAAAAVAAPAPTGAPAPEAAAPAQLTLPAATPGPGALVLPAAALLALAAAALLASRRRRRAPRLVNVLESTSIGPKRSLVVARIGGEVLVIGSSEAGLQLLAARPAGLEGATAALEALEAPAPARLQAVPDPAPEAAPGKGAVLGLLSRLRPRAARAAAPAEAAGGFDALLAESTEDLELRRKLALGQSGSVR